MNTRRHLRLLPLVLALIFGFSVQISASMSLLPSSDVVGDGTSPIPRGATSMIKYFRVKATTIAHNLAQVTIRNESPHGFGQSSGVTQVILYLDKNDDQVYDEGAETEKARVSFTNTVSQAVFNITSLENIPTSSPTGKGFFIVYKLAVALPLTTSVNCTITEVKDNSSPAVPATMVGADVEMTADVSGLQTVTAVSFAPTTVIPGQTKVAALKITIVPEGEDIRNYDISIRGESSLYGSDRGIKKAYLYLDNGGATVDRLGALLSTVSGTASNGHGFVSSANLVFKSVHFETQTPDDVIIFSTPSTKNFVVVYDMGTIVPVTTNVTVQSQLVGFRGTGSTSGLDMTHTVAAPSTPAKSLVAGLSFSSLASIVPQNSAFGPGTFSPILKFELAAQHATATVNSVTLLNTGSIPYITDNQNKNGVIKIEVFSDGDGDKSFDGAGSNDPLIGSLLLGNGNESGKALIPITNGVAITSGNIKTLFVVYHFGTSVAEAKDASGNVSSIVTARLHSAGGTIFAGGLDRILALSGTLPAAAVPEAKISLASTDVYLRDIKSITPTTSIIAVRGETKVPMLYMTFYSAQVTTTSIHFTNEGETYLNDARGVNKIWLYRDVTPNQKLDETDIFLGSVERLRSNTQKATVAPIPLLQGENHILVLYDIGQEASTEVGKIRAQLSGVTGVTGNTVIFGGELPSPKEAAKLTVSPRPVSITSVSLVQSSDTTAKKYFPSIKVRNTSAADVQIKNLAPRVYLGSISGQDITFAFKTSANDQYPVTLTPGTERTFSFDMGYSRITQSSPAVVDAALTYGYGTGFGRTSVLDRYSTGTSGQTTSAALANADILLTSMREKRTWDLPAYVDSLKVISNGGLIRFQVGEAVAPNSQMQINLVNGAAINESSLVVKLNGTPLSGGITPSGIRFSPLSSTFFYRRDSGTIQISNLGNASGTITLAASDLGGNALEIATIPFIISDKMQISDALFFPNPFVRGSRTLDLGFSITAPGDVTIFIFNHLGQKVYQDLQTFASLGYKIISIDANKDFLISGIYVCRLIAKDSFSNTSSATTKLAIF